MNFRFWVLVCDINIFLSCSDLGSALDCRCGTVKGRGERLTVSKKYGSGVGVDRAIPHTAMASALEFNAERVFDLDYAVLLFCRRVVAQPASAACRPLRIFGVLQSGLPDLRYAMADGRQWADSASSAKRPDVRLCPHSEHWLQSPLRSA